ncbi:MAG: radical SAM family heme chaperone HemW [Aggregatilineaceae bacterium]
MQSKTAILPGPVVCQPTPLALYVHIPFCRTRCTYCDFNTYAGMQTHIPTYVEALRREVSLVAAAAGDRPPALSVYFGGGTPSQLPVFAVQQIVETCKAAFPLDPAAEISFEMNPGDADASYFAGLCRAGVNRLSIGMQSAHESELRLFARRHTLADVFDTVRLARQAGLASINLDLIYGIPDQTLAMWQHSLQMALRCEPDHLSLYSLSFEEGTPLSVWLREGKITAPDPDLAADMYDWAAEVLEGAGYRHYEISNWARPGHACQHNLHVWRNWPYLGFGAGAHGYAGGVRYETVAAPAIYIARLAAQREPMAFPLSAAVASTSTVDDAEAMADTMILGLRLLEEGVAPETFRARFGHTPQQIFGPALQRLQAQQLIEQADHGRIRLTRKAYLLANRVFVEFV